MRSSRSSVDWLVVGTVLLFVVVLVVGVWLHFKAPCGWFTLKDAPLRCVVGR